jgi:hypothetical protein
MNGVMRSIFFKLSVFILLTQQSPAQNIDPQDYFPCGIGDKWQWHATASGTNDVVEVTRDSTDRNGNKYIFMNQENVPRYRLDTLHNVFQFLNLIDPLGHITLGTEILLYKLDAAIGDSFYTMNDKFIVKVSGYTSTIFGQSTIIRTFTWTPVSGSGLFVRSSIALRFGLVSSEGPIDDQRLTGCVIGGVPFGNLLSAYCDNDIAPHKCILMQNYPNPFNPSTTLSYSLSARSEVSLNVYDCLGRIVATVAEGVRDAGQHQVLFDASSLSSGMYFYRLTAGELAATRKMIVAK